MSYTNLLYHIVYGTKDRLPLITKELRPDLHRYLGGLVNRLHGTPLEINGMADHVHVGPDRAGDLDFGVPWQIQISFVRLGQSPDTRQIQMAGEVWCVHCQSIAG